jgi:GNAT superfamily N-acetyltransferase
MDERTLQLADRNWCRANGLFMSSSERGEILESQHLHLTCCGLPAATFNVAYLKPPVSALDASVRRAEAYFRPRDLPFRITLRSDYEPACTARLEAAGYHPAGRMPGMILAPIRAPDGAPDELAIREVESADDLALFQETAFAGFGLPPGLGARFLTEALAETPGVRLYLGRVGGEPVCTSALIATEGVAGIYWVATLPERRGKGFGEAITWAAVRGGVERGCSVASLQASELGRPVYARMGFATAIEYVHFEPTTRT